MAHRKITRKIWEDANSQWVIVTMWQPKPGRKRQTPTVKVAGDYPTYAKARAAKARMERTTDPYYSPERRSIFVARKFDVSKLDIFDSFSYDVEESS
jgi:hypothetical protein